MLKHKLQAILIACFISTSSYGLEANVASRKVPPGQANRLIQNSDKDIQKSKANVAPINAATAQAKVVKQQVKSIETSVKNMETCGDSNMLYSSNSKKCFSPGVAAQKLFNDLGCQPGEVIKNVNGVATCSSVSAASCSCNAINVTYKQAGPNNQYSKPATFNIPQTNTCGDRYQAVIPVTVTSAIAQNWVIKGYTAYQTTTGLKAICTTTGWRIANRFPPGPWPVVTGTQYWNGPPADYLW